MSSLAAQLAQHASLNTALLADRSKRKAAESYLFTGRDADQHDLDAILALGTNGFLKLCSLDTRLSKFEFELFSDHARSVDRTLLGKAEDERLSETIAEFLALLGPWFLEAPTARVIEWLVRRFRINEFNIESLLVLFLPYHDTQQFAKLVTILHIKPNTTWSFLVPFKSAAQNVPRVSLVTEMLKNGDVSRFVASLLPNALKEDHSHRTLLAFNAATMHEFISRSKFINEGTMAYVLPAVLEPLQKEHDVSKDAILGSFILLSALSHKCELSSSALKAILREMAASAGAVATKQFVSAIIAVCEPQEELDALSKATTKAILTIPDIREGLQEAANWVGSTKFLRPLVPALVLRIVDANSSLLLESLIATPMVPGSVIERAAALLLDETLSNIDPEKSTSSRALLSIIQQRHPQVFQLVTRNAQEDETVKQLVEQLVLSLSLDPTSGLQNKESADIVLASTNADTNVRVMAVKEMLSHLARSDSLKDADKQSITSALLSRVQDPEQEVIEALYKQPALVTPLFKEEASTYIQALSTSFGVKPKRSYLRLHLAFVTQYFYPAVESKFKKEIVSEIFFPYLLFSKPRQHTAEAVWDIILEHMGGERGEEFEILRGCAELVKVERENAEDPMEKMRVINTVVSTTIAQNILVSNRLFELVSTVLSSIKSTNAHSRSLGYLIAESLIGKLSGQHQIDIARQILDGIKIEEIGGIDDLAAEHEQFSQTLKEIPSKNIVLKPNKTSTLSWLQVSLISTISSISPPEGLNLNWISDRTSSNNKDTCGSSYVKLMRYVYNLINRSSSLPVLTSNLLRIFFLNATSDALVFLAGIWSAPEGQETDSLKEVALRHAAAFLEAHVLEDDGLDFQIILPTLLVALQNSAAPVRRAAVECLTRIRLISERKLINVYKFDLVYGDVKDTLQYLAQDDLKKYLAYLVAHQQHFVQDPTYLQIAHGDHLTPVKSDKKKEIEYKSHVLCYLLSHVNALDQESIEISLLECLSLVSASLKSISLLSSIQSLCEKEGDEKLTCLLLSSIDASSVVHLNDSEEGLWDTYLKVIEKFFQQNESVAARDILIRNLEKEIFAKLNSERKAVVCDTVISIAAREPEAQSYCKKLLSHIIKEVPLIVQLLDQHTPAVQGSTPRAAKRIKSTETTETDSKFSELTVLTEVLGTNPLTGSLVLVSALLETLSKVIQSNAAPQADVNYVQQMLMASIDNCASNIQETPNVTPSVIRLDVLVEVIRVVDNPQTFHQALLLMASLARLAPDSVLRNVMPVFTFMGSNVFHRDDTYSFRVVQKTIDGIVPVMAASLTKANATPLDLYIASRDFLHVFTDAANHIPRHRRTNFFIHLVDVLGAEHFLAPVCMLLSEKLSNRVVKQEQEELSNTLALPIALLHHNSPTVQINALVEILQESQRLVTCAVNPINKVPALLDYLLDGESAVSTLAYVKRAQTLITLIGQTINFKITTGTDSKDGLNYLVSGLITLSTVSENANGVKISGLAVAAQNALVKVLSAMPAISFIEAVVNMLASDNTIIHIGALELLAERIPKISDRIRREITLSVDTIVESIVKLLAQDDVTLQLKCLRGLKAIASSLAPREEGQLTAALPSILVTVQVPQLVSSALDVLQPLSTKLGPRIIPFFKDIVSKSVVLLKDADDLVMEKTTAVLHGLLTSIPAFWGTDAITQMVNLYMDHCVTTSGSPKAAMSSLTKAISKKVPSKVLLPNLMELWPTVLATKDLDRISAFFDIFARALRYAPRANVLEQIRGLAKIFLEALDSVKVSNSNESKAEIQVIAAFKEFVVKLNESTFRPVFRRFYDWAFVDENVDIARKITFFHTYSSLLDFFKALMVPYTSFLVQAFVDHLKSLVNATEEGQYALWVSLITTLTKSLNYDDGAFWRDDKLRQIVSPLIKQVPLCIKLPTDLDGKALFQKCLNVLVEDITDDAILKNVNLELLMHTRSENTKIRQFALNCSDSLWRIHGGKLLGFVTETATFIAECGEDENDMVVKESFRLKDAVESIAGKIDGL